MPNTPLGITYPDKDAHTRLWEHFQQMAEDVEGLLDIDGQQTRPWHYHTNATWTFTNGSIDVTYGSTLPDGWEWVGVPTPIAMLRSNSFPGVTPRILWVGNVSNSGCTLHQQLATTGAAVTGASAVSFGLVGLIRRIA